MSIRAHTRITGARAERMHMYTDFCVHSLHNNRMANRRKPTVRWNVGQCAGTHMRVRARARTRVSAYVCPASSEDIPERYDSCVRRAPDAPSP